MGLDMYLYKRKKGKDNSEDKNVAYFRKHSHLHGYMNDLYRKRGGLEDFNCIELELSKEDIEKILEKSEQEITSRDAFEPARGFFWGQSTEEDWIDTFEAMNRILDDTDFSVEQIIYYSWW